MRKIVLALAGVFVFACGAQLSAQSLKGSRTAMKRQNHVAQKQDYTFLRTSRDVRRFVENGLLVPVKSSASLRLSDGVSFPYARPAVRTFAQRLSAQYKSGCGERMTVTSLTRPLSSQPWNASDLSVHPAGMALDIRVSDRRSCRRWLEQALVGLEAKGLIDATREHFPAHYHVAVFTGAYERYVAKLSDGPTRQLAAAGQSAKQTEPRRQLKIATAARPTYASVLPLPASSNAAQTTHKVRPGESLWSIAKQHGVTVTALKNANDLHSAKIRAGQVLAVPTARGSEAD